LGPIAISHQSVKHQSVKNNQKTINRKPSIASVGDGFHHPRCIQLKLVALGSLWN
jgi:hypothetical protein